MSHGISSGSAAAGHLAPTVCMASHPRPSGRYESIFFLPFLTSRIAASVKSLKSQLPFIFIKNGFILTVLKTWLGKDSH